MSGDLTGLGGHLYEGLAYKETFVMISDALPSPGAADLVVTGDRAELPRGLRLIWRTADKEGESRP